MKIHSKHFEAMKELRELCKKYGLTIYSHDGIYDGAHGEIVLSFGAKAIYKARWFCGNTNEVKVDETIAIASEGE